MSRHNAGRGLNLLVALWVWVGLVVGLWSSPAEAIPPFARAYGVPCSTCHITVTRRNEFGDAFRKAGYHWPSLKELVDQNPSDPPIQFRGFGALESQLPSSLPVGAIATLSGAANFAAENSADQLTLGSPSVNLVLGGSFGSHVSFFGTWAVQGTPNELYVHIARPIRNRPEFNLRVGLFEQSTTMFKANESLIARFQLGSSALNGHAVSQSRIGLEANGVIGRRVFYAAGMVRNAALRASADGYYHLSTKIGGLDFLGQEKEFDLDDEPSFAEEKVSFEVGHWGYFGQVSNTEGKRTTRVRRFGIDAKLRIAKFGLWAGSMLGVDHDNVRDRARPSFTWFAESTFTVTSWLTAAYNFQFQDTPSLKRASMQHDVGVILMLIENMRIRLRYSFSDDKTNNDRAELQLLFGF